MQPIINIRPLTDDRLLILLLSICFVLTCSSFSIAAPGEKKWEFTTGDAISSSPAIDDDGTIYVGSIDDRLYALNQDGTKKWEFLCTDSIKSTSPAIGADGTVYVGSMDNHIYAIEGESRGLAESPWPKFRGSYKSVGRKIGSEAEVSPTQASGVTVRVKNCCAKKMTPAEVSSKYSAPRYDMLSTIRSFNATINANSGCATFKFNATISLTDATVSDLKLVKFYDTNGSSHPYRTYAASAPEYDVDGTWWLTDASENHMAPTDTLTAGNNYYVYFVVRDNGDYDEERTLGEITDPIGLVNNSEGSGCVLNSNADFSIEWMFMGIIVLALMFKRRFLN